MAQDLKGEIKRLQSNAIQKRITQRALASLHTEVENRIFVKGLDSNGRRIGRYSEAYQKTRARKNYPPSNKVILQAENAMVNDFKFGVAANGNYASGFTFQNNFDKSKWVESTYDKDIFALSQDEEKRAFELIMVQLKKFLNG